VNARQTLPPAPPPGAYPQPPAAPAGYPQPPVAQPGGYPFRSDGDTGDFAIPPQLATGLPFQQERAPAFATAEMTTGEMTPVPGPPRVAAALPFSPPGGMYAQPPTPPMGMQLPVPIPNAPPAAPRAAPSAQAPVALSNDGYPPLSAVQPLAPPHAPVASPPGHASGPTFGPGALLPAPGPYPFAAGRAAPAPQPSSGPAGVRLTIEHFAGLSAEIAHARSTPADVFSRYGLDEPSYLRETEAWRTRFASDAESFRSYSVLFQQYAEWLQRNVR
jgi:hypothetical protein